MMTIGLHMIVMRTIVLKMIVVMTIVFQMIVVRTIPQLRKDIGLRFLDFGSKVFKHSRAEESKFVCLSNSLLMNLGQDQLCNQPTVHSGGVSMGRVRGCGC